MVCPLDLGNCVNRLLAMMSMSHIFCALIGIPNFGANVSVPERFERISCYCESCFTHFAGRNGLATPIQLHHGRHKVGC